MKLRRFSKDKDLHLKITEMRNAGFTLAEIHEKYPQYSTVTYKRFFKSLGIKSTKRNEQSKKKMSEMIRLAWKNMEPEKKAKHIEHLRRNAKEQRGKSRTFSDTWKENNLKHLRSEKMREITRRFNSSRKKYTPEVIARKVSELGVTIVGDISDSSNVVLVYPKSGAPRRLEVKVLMKMDRVLPRFTSAGEEGIRLFVESLGLKCSHHRIGRSELDIYIPEKNIAIEFNGLFWHSEARKSKNYHLDKTKLAESKGIRLIHIFEHEWLYRKEQAFQFLKSVLNPPKNKTDVKDCEVVSVPCGQAVDIINKYHIQPLTKVDFSVGLFHKGNMEALGVFEKHPQGYVLSGFTNFGSIEAHTALSLISKESSGVVGDIEAYVDIRLSDGDEFTKAGWFEEERTPPDYFCFYGINGKIEIARRESDFESAPRKILKVYDCGKIRFIYKAQKTSTLPTS